MPKHKTKTTNYQIYRSWGYLSTKRVKCQNMTIITR